MNVINYSDSLTEQMLIYQQNWSYYNHEQEQRQEQEPTSIISNYYPTTLNFYQPNYISQPERDCINNHIPIKPQPTVFDHPTYRPYQSNLPKLLPLPDYFSRELPINSTSSTNSYPSPDRPHGCQFPGCNRYFKRLEHVKRHYRSIHTKLRPYPCPNCPKSFSRSDNLAQHARVHRQSQPLIPRSPLTTSDPPTDRPLTFFSPHPSSLTATATTTTTNSP